MDGADLTTPTAPMAMQHPVSTRPTLGFPLGTALLLVIIFCLSGIFSCCYHWDKLRSLRRRSHHLPTTTPPPPPQVSIPSPPSYKLTSKDQNSKEENEQSLPVIMPGDQIPKFMAWPCPRPPSLPSTASSMITVGVVLLPSIPSHAATPPLPSYL